MGVPGAVERDQTTSVDRSTEDVLWIKVPFVPDNDLTSQSAGCMLALPDCLEPFPVRIVAMFEPLVDQRVSGIVVKCFAYELAHRQGWLRKRRITLSLLLHGRRHDNNKSLRPRGSQHSRGSTPALNADTPQLKLSLHKKCQPKTSFQSNRPPFLLHNAQMDTFQNSCTACDLLGHRQMALTLTNVQHTDVQAEA